ncbi:MAG TPA: TIGR01459 family HAD-type hydrolase [Rhizomicrobium sp.]|nr:TIGR01459 family HAD-type hydrolase [Rhizomicrobium sp.]
MSSSPIILNGLREIASDYDALICDVWGVLHNGKHARADAVDALQKFRKSRGPVVLLSNAPRPVSDLEKQFVHFGVPPDCYDAIMTSGVAARDDLERRAHGERLPILHIGPERDRGVFEGLPIDCVDAAHAKVVLCTGLYDDDHETPDDYRDTLNDLRARGFTMLCANPDIVVQRGSKLIYCAGAIAREYQKIGGEVVYYGKPHLPVYGMTLARAREAAGREILRPLAIGDGLETDIRGANAAGIDALFIADGVHGEEIGDVTPQSLAALFAKSGTSARAAMRALVW